VIRFGSILGRYLLVWLVYVLALLLVASIMPGVHLDTDNPQWWFAVLLLPVEFALLIILLRPLLLFLTLPLNVVTLGLPTLFFNGVLLYVASQAHRSVVIANLHDALLASLVMTAIAAPLTSLLGLDEAYPLYQRLLYRLGRRWGPRAERSVRTGLLILQVDGLAYRNLLAVLQAGRMPTLSAMLARGTHQLHRWYCGLPSNTPAVPAGFFYGNRYDVAGYRWYDRDAQAFRVVKNPDDTRALEERVSVASEGLLAGGSAINTLLSGGAQKRLLTVAAMGASRRDARRGERADLNLFLLSPHAYTKAVLTAIWDSLAGFALGMGPLVRRGRPCLRHHPLRMAQSAAINGFLRSISFHLMKQDIVRGLPVIYSNYVGYDDVAHMTDPESPAAKGALAAFDRNLHQLRRFARRERALAYEIMVLADHGQTASMPFRLLYGKTLGMLLAELAGQAVTEDATASEETVSHEAFYLSSLLTQLEADDPRAPWTIQRGRHAVAGLRQRRLRETWAQRRQRVPQATGVAEDPAAAPLEAPPELAVCVSGCLAHVYVKGRREPLDLEELMALYPRLIPSLAGHPGIGFVAATREYGDAVAIGRDGVCNLITGRVVGRLDPLAPFGEAEQLRQELAQLLSYPSSGDLVINGAWLADRQQVVVLEEQLSSHGGVGGPQTEPFVILPASWRTRPDDLASPEALHRHVARHLRWLHGDGAR
jgi:uncharacterized membrane protein YvlD (DUF360 family)